MATKGKTRNYTVKEKQLFIKIVQKYSHVGENLKKSAASLQDKDAAWERIFDEYNASTIIEEERCEKQLQKLWTNLKQSQRDALTKKRQSLFLTGGDPPAAPATIDSEVSAIVPNLMTTAPALFTSTLDEETLIERENLAICDDTQKILSETVDDDELCDVTEVSLRKINDLLVGQGSSEMSQLESQGTDRSEMNAKRRRSTSSTPAGQKSRRTNQKGDLDHEEEDWKIRRSIDDSIIEQETALFKQKKRHEEELHEINKAKSAFDLREAKARAELAELRLAKEKKYKNVKTQFSTRSRGVRFDGREDFHWKAGRRSAKLVA